VTEYLIRIRPIFLGLVAIAAIWPSILAAKGAPPGRYKCWFYNTPQPLKNFTLMKNGSYIDASGVSGSVTISGKKIKFSGGNLDGRTGIYNGGNPPTISFYNADGEEVLLCQRGSYNKGVRKQ
jgi:hypothetical protein